MDYDDLDYDLDPEWDEDDEYLPDDRSKNEFAETTQRNFAHLPCFSLLNNSIKLLHHYSCYSSISYVRAAADVLLYAGPTEQMLDMWPMENPIHRSYDDCLLASHRRGIIGLQWAPTLRNVHKDDDYYLRRPQDMRFPFDHSIRGTFFSFPYYWVDQFEEIHGDFLDIIDGLRQRCNAAKEHRKRHQKRGKKRKGTKSKTAAPPSKSNQPGHFAQHEDSDFDEAMDCSEDPV